VTNEARRRYDKGMSAREAAFDIALGRFAEWGDAERVVVTVRTLFEDFKGERIAPDFMDLFEQMSLMRAKLHGHAHGHGHTHS
jgi:hypothetical protein